MLPNWSTKFELKPGKWVFIPTEDCIKSGRELKLIIEKAWLPPEFFFHLRAGGHVQALKSHLGNSFFAHLDIKDFFGSISKTRVTRSLKSFFPYSKAREIANLSTVRHPTHGNSMLPFGFVQSPILASVCLQKSALGNFLQHLYHREDIDVSVYVDDIIISSNNDVDLSHAIAEIKKLSIRSGFFLNSDKESLPSPQITVFNIQLSNLSMTIDPTRWAQFVTSFRDTPNENVRQGIYTYVASVDPSLLSIFHSSYNPAA